MHTVVIPTPSWMCGVSLEEICATQIQVKETKQLGLRSWICLRSLPSHQTLMAGIRQPGDEHSFHQALLDIELNMLFLRGKKEE